MEQALSRAVAQQRMGYLTVHGHLQPPVMHALTLLHDPIYREANAGALCTEWSRIPLPNRPDGD